MSEVKIVNSDCMTTRQFVYDLFEGLIQAVDKAEKDGTNILDAFRNQTSKYQCRSQRDVNSPDYENLA